MEIGWTDLGSRGYILVAIKDIKSHTLIKKIKNPTNKLKNFRKKFTIKEFTNHFKLQYKLHRHNK
jgi:hypothetical protein